MGRKDDGRKRQAGRIYAGVQVGGCEVGSGRTSMCDDGRESGENSGPVVCVSGKNGFVGSQSSTASKQGGNVN